MPEFTDNSVLSLAVYTITGATFFTHPRPHHKNSTVKELPYKCAFLITCVLQMTPQCMRKLNGHAPCGVHVVMVLNNLLLSDRCLHASSPAIDKFTRFTVCMVGTDIS